jgi:hypothetical protein
LPTVYTFTLQQNDSISIGGTPGDLFNFIPAPINSGSNTTYSDNTDGNIQETQPTSTTYAKLTNVSPVPWGQVFRRTLTASQPGSSDVSIRMYIERTTQFGTDMTLRFENI